MEVILGERTRISFSVSPLHLAMMELVEMLKKVALLSVAIAFARDVLPERLSCMRGFAIDYFADIHVQ